MKHKIYSVSEFAELKGVSRAYIHELISNNRLDAVKVGNTWIVKSEKVKPVKRGRPKK